MEMANKSAQSGGNCSASNCDVVVWRGGGGGGRRRGLTKGEQEEEEKEEEERGGAGGDLTVKCGFCSSADCDQNGLFKMTTIDGSSSSSSSSSSSASGSLSSCRLLERHNLSSSSSSVSRQLFDFVPFVTSIFFCFEYICLLIIDSTKGDDDDVHQGVTNNQRRPFQQIIY